jgi:ATP diphosphatase
VSQEVPGAGEPRRAPRGAASPTGDPRRDDSDGLVRDRTAGIERLLEIMRRLRAPDGCPWDREQSFRTIAPYTIEEACEVADAIERGAMAELADELGDLLLQVVYHAQMAEEIGEFSFADVVRAISDKMVRRHPHVFGAERGAPLSDPADVDWEGIKAAERDARGEARDSALDGVPRTLSGLTRAVALTRRAARVGFDWTDPKDVLAKLAEEAAELTAEMDRADRDRMEEEYGDLLFVLANLARHLKVDPESALRRANAKFDRRFRAIEQALAREGRRPEEATLAEMDALWDRAKAAEKG